MEEQNTEQAPKLKRGRKPLNLTPEERRARTLQQVKDYQERNRAEYNEKQRLRYHEKKAEKGIVTRPYTRREKPTEKPAEKTN